MDTPDWITEIIRETRCEYCGVSIVYARTRRGIGVFDAETWRPHRFSCPYADRWAKGKKKEVKQTHLDDFLG